MTEETAERALLFLLRMVAEQQAELNALSSSLHANGISMEQKAEANLFQILQHWEDRAIRGDWGDDFAALIQKAIRL